MKHLALASSVILLGCGIRLDEPSPAEKPKSEAPIVEACRWFADAGDRVSGRVSSVLLGDGNRLFVAGAVGNQANVGFVAPESATPDTCFAGATRIDHPVLVSENDQALSPVVIDGVPWIFFARFEAKALGFPERVGIGVARWDESAESFVPGESLLWTGDRPSFGSGALVEGGFVYAYGCQEGGFLSSDCFIARAPASAIDDESAWEYYAGGGHFSTALDDAFRVFAAGDPVAVVRVPGRERFLAAYVTPLGEEVVLRTGLAPFGPWSKPVAGLGCELEDAFCGDAVLHTFQERLFVGYSINTFEAGATDSNPEAFWTRLAPVEVPSNLP